MAACVSSTASTTWPSRRVPLVQTLCCFIPILYSHRTGTPAAVTLTLRTDPARATAPQVLTPWAAAAASGVAEACDPAAVYLRRLLGAGALLLGCLAHSLTEAASRSRHLDLLTSIKVQLMEHMHKAHPDSWLVLQPPGEAALGPQCSWCCCCAALGGLWWTCPSPASRAAQQGWPCSSATVHSWHDQMLTCTSGLACQQLQSHADTAAASPACATHAPIAAICSCP